MRASQITARLFTATALSYAIASFANAQTEDTNANLLEEVIVTAQKRAENLTDVPISIASVSEDTMKKTGIRDVREMAEFVPNLGISSGLDQNTNIRIRGVGSNSRNIGFDTRVGVYVDGVYLGQSPAQNMDILDLSRIEVLRGPQGTLFGKNTVAGAINLITNQADETLYGNMGVEVGNYNSHKVSGTINLPISDTVFTRFSISDQSRDGYIKNLYTGDDVQESDGTSFRGQVRYVPNDKLEFAVSVDGLKSDRRGYNGEPTTNTFGSTNTDPNAPQELDINVNRQTGEEREIKGISGIVDYEFENSFALKSITAYRETEVGRANHDSDYSPNDWLYVNYAEKYEQLSQEFQLLSPSDGRLSYVAGLYLYQQKASNDWVATLGQDVGSLFSVLAPPLAGAAPLFVGESAGTRGDLKTESIALYINGTYDITDRLTLGFGARYTEETKKVDWALYGSNVEVIPNTLSVPVTSIFSVATGPLSDDGLTNVYPVEDKNKYNNFSPTINLSYAINDATTAYARYSSAFKSGGFNLDFINEEDLASGIDFDTETVDAFEIGIKGTTENRRFQYAISAFAMSFDDYQINQFVDLGNGTSAITIKNAATVDSRGLEFEFTALPTDNLTITGSMAYLDSTFESFENGGTALNPNGVGADVSGNSLPGAPEYSGALGLQYNLPLSRVDGDFVARLDYTYQGETYTSVDNIKTVSTGSSTGEYGYVDSIGLVNGRIGIETATWSLFAWARNLTDKEYNTHTGRDFFGTNRKYPGQPRTYGLEISYSY